MMRSSVRSAGLAILLTMNGCGSLTSSGTGTNPSGLSVAEAALEGGSGQLALQVSEGVLRDTPNNMQAMAIKGDALTLLGEYADANAAFQALLAKDPNSVRANTGLGRLKLSKEPAAAEALFQTVLKQDPKDLTALNNLGIARDLQGHHNEAQAAYRQALSVSPGLDSAQVNLALSLAMTGQSAEAIQLLKAKASDPGASAKVRRDYAVVQAMAGNRSEAERVLSVDMSADQARQVLDSATGARTRPVRDETPGQMVAQDQTLPEDVVPPDVVQVPEGRAPNGSIPEMRAAQATGRQGPMTTPTVAQMAAAPAPMVVRPRPADADSEAPMVQPTDSIAAATVNQRPLALPLRSGDVLPPMGAASPMPESGHARDQETAPGLVTPEVLAIEPVQPPRHALPAAIRIASSDTAQANPPDAPPSSPVPAAASPQPPAPAARVEPLAPKGATARTGVTSAEVTSVQSGSTATSVAAAPARTANIVPEPSRVVTEAASPPSRTASIAPALRWKSATEATETAAPIATGSRDGNGPAVQFAAMASEESAHAFWQSLMDRFPHLLGQREPTVIRFEHAGTVFWRVRAEGFGTFTEAQTLCAQMRGNGQNCFVPRS